MNYRSCSCSSSLFLLPGLAVALLGGVGGCVGVKKRTVNLNMSRTMLCPHIQIQVESQKRFFGCLLYKKEQKVKNG